MAVKKERIEIIKLLLSNDNIDVNYINIPNIYLFITFKIIYFNDISKFIFQRH